MTKNKYHFKLKQVLNQRGLVIMLWYLRTILVSIFLTIGSFLFHAVTDEIQICNWPQFHGPQRDNISRDKNLIKSWPEEGPKLIWKTTGIGYGFSSVSISDGMIFTAGEIEGNTVITAISMQGDIIWQTKGGAEFTKSHGGSRGTPTISDGKVYHLNGNGHLLCLESRNGKKVWELNIMEKFGGRNSEWGLSESLLVDGENVICCPGGEEIGIVALNKHNGQTVWVCTGINDKPAYCSPILVDYKGLRQIITVMYGTAVGVAADTGRLLWKYPQPVNYGSNISTPVYHDGHIVLFQTFGLGATMLKLNVEGDTCLVEKVWHTGELDNEHGGVVLIDGYLYGHADGNHKWRHWACLELKTGKTMYSVEGLPSGASGSLTYADGMLYLLG
ncbi:PQQ-like beta-propeller repeat protein, partial [Candidatus Poribacteria bacterium]|nr:PQQ-like beta-propeller repeat protein [Candidatus Poribacteria bacterium]